MNWLLLSRMLGLLGMLVGGSMIFSLPWAFPICGQTQKFEADGFFGLLAALGCSVSLSGCLYYVGRRESGSILRKEALAVVGLGWLFAGVLGSLPFLFGGTMRTAQEPMSVVDALFESVSGFTTTGASVLTQLETPDNPNAEPGTIELGAALFAFLAKFHSLAGRNGHHRAVRRDPWPFGWCRQSPDATGSSGADQTNRSVHGFERPRF